MEDEGEMKKKEKACSIALASTFVVLFLIFVSSTASASIERDLHRAPPDIPKGAGDPSNGRVVSDEFSTERNNTSTESVGVAVNITERRLTSSGSVEDPVIYGNKIVWADCRSEDGNWDIYMYDLSTSKETRITTNSSDQYYPDIYSNRIIWQDMRNDDINANSDIYMYNLSTSKETSIITNDSAQYTPAIYGDKIVWHNWRNTDYDLCDDIYVYDLSTSTETHITKCDGIAYDPDIYGDKIVWEEERGYSYDIYMYDLSTSTETKITTDGSDQLNPSIYGDRIVWEDWRNDDGNSNVDIYMYNLSTKKETQITTNPSASWDPAIYGNRIVWTDDRNGNWDIYVYDLATGQETHTTETSAQRHPNIYGDRIVWEDYRNGNPEIYMGTLSSTFPVAAFSASPTSGKAPLNVSFTDNSTGAPTSWKWNFGDGTNSTLQNPKHTYSKAGNYTVRLTAINDAGSNTKTKSSYIKVATKPVANFTSDVTSGYAPLNVAFTDKSKGTPTSWSWNFGDGTNSTIQNPTHTYSKAGNYTVVLTASNSAGSSKTTKPSYIKVKPATRPVANFTSNVTSGYAPLDVSFTDKSSGSPTSWKWTFGDGINSTQQNPVHTYSKAGNYTVVLTAINSAGSNKITKPSYIKVKTVTSQVQTT